MADEFYDLFNQLFLSTDPWGLIGPLIVIVGSLLFAAKVKYSWLFLASFQVLMVISYVNLGTSYSYHVVLLLFGAVFTVIAGNRREH